MHAYTLGTHGFDSRLIIGSGKYTLVRAEPRVRGRERRARS